MMKHLFRPEGEAALVRILKRQPLLAFDFDGTLTPIVARPEDAHLSKAVSTRLAVLSQYLPVAIVTGRKVSDVRERLGFDPQFIVGNHGAEDPDRVAAVKVQSDSMDLLRLELNSMSPQLSKLGVFVEDKAYSLALHYRLSRDREKARHWVEQLLLSHSDLKIFDGKMVINVLPQGAPAKAEAARELLARSGKSCLVFAGDDVNDEPVFCIAPDDWLTIRVGRDGGPSQAQYYLDSPAEMAMVLERMVSFFK
jgi:trehalose 6-phosphate phosphatase